MSLPSNLLNRTFILLTSDDDKITSSDSSRLYCSGGSVNRPASWWSQFLHYHHFYKLNIKIYTSLGETNKNHKKVKNVKINNQNRCKIKAQTVLTLLTCQKSAYNIKTCLFINRTNFLDKDPKNRSYSKKITSEMTIKL